LEPVITSSLDTIQRTILALAAQLAPISVRQEEMELQAKAAREEQTRLIGLQMQKSREQEEAEQQRAELEYLGRETAKVVSDMQTTLEATREVDGLITEQHEGLDQVDQTIAGALDEMRAGNAEVTTAERHQKTRGISCRICDRVN
jgi:chromosome segregation ATPase